MPYNTQTLRELIELINDEALFHKREIPGDADDFEHRDDTSLSPKYDLYECINMLIAIYDMHDNEIDDPKVIDMISSIKHKIKDCAH